MSVHNDAVAEAIAGGSVTARGWAYAKCPICNSKRRSLSANIDTGWWRCFRCGERGRLKGFTDYGARAPEAPPPKPSDWLSLADPDVFGSIAAVGAYEYLVKRRVSFDTVVDAQLGVAFKGKLAGRVVLPIFDDDAKCVAVVARRWTPGDQPYYNTPGLDRTWMPGRKVLLEQSDIGVYGVEGPFDCLPYWGHAFSFLGKPVDKQLAWILRHARRPVILGLDGDAHAESRRCAARLSVRGVRAAAVYLPAVQDPGDFPLPPPWTVGAHSTKELHR